MATAKDRYESLPKVRRIAMLLVMIGPESAAKILRSFEEPEVEAISREMVSIDLIEEDFQKLVLEEFSSLLVDSVGSVRGGYEVALGVLEKARGSYSARNMVGRIAPARDFQESLEEISEMEPPQLANLLKSEQPQTIAFLLGAMQERRAAELLTLLPEKMRSEVVLRMGTLEPASSAVLNKVVKNLSRFLERQAPQPRTQLGGVDRVANILNQMDKSLSKGLLSELEDANSALGARVRKKMFSFNDLLALSVQDLQRIMREVDSSTLVMAIKPASAALKEHLLSALSKRAGESLQEELDLLGSVRLKEVEAAQESIINIVRQLEEEGEISVGDEEENAFV